MRSRSLEEVAAAFATWRRTRAKVGPIPEKLWSAAVELLERHSQSAVCRRLRLDPGRLKQVRQQRVSARGLRAARLSQPDVSVTPPVLVGTGTRVEAVGGFVELAPMPAMLPGAGRSVDAASACRLTLETSTGTLSVVTAGPDTRLLERVCALAVGMLEARASS